MKKNNEKNANMRDLMINKIGKDVLDYVLRPYLGTDYIYFCDDIEKFVKQVHIKPFKLYDYYKYNKDKKILKIAKKYYKKQEKVEAKILFKIFKKGVNDKILCGFDEIRFNSKITRAYLLFGFRIRFSSRRSPRYYIETKTGDYIIGSYKQQTNLREKIKNKIYILSEEENETRNLVKVEKIDVKCRKNYIMKIEELHNDKSIHGYDLFEYDGFIYTSQEKRCIGQFGYYIFDEVSKYNISEGILRS